MDNIKFQRMMSPNAVGMSNNSNDPIKRQSNGVKLQSIDLNSTMLKNHTKFENLGF